MSITKFLNLIPRDHLEEMTVTPFNFSKSSRQEKLVAERMAGDTLNLTILKNSKIAKKYTLVLESRPDFSVHENAINGIKIAYPSGWHYTDTQEYGLLVFSHKYVTDQRLEIYISPVQNKSLEQFSHEEIDKLKSRLTNLKFVESNVTKIANSPAFVVKYSYNCPPTQCTCAFEIATCPTTTFKTIEIWTVNENKLYRIKIDGTNPFPFDDLSYWANIQKMLDSFQFIPTFKDGIYESLKK